MYAHCTYVENRTVNALPTTDSEVIANGNTEEHSELFMILSVVFLITSVIMTIMCIVLSWKLCCQARRKEGTYIYTYL